MFKLRDITPRVKKLRNRYRDTVPTLDAERAGILTEFLKENRDDVPVIRQAKALHAILANMTVRVEPEELLVGNMAKNFRGCCLWPEFSGLGWLVDELDSGLFDKKEAHDAFMYMDEEDRRYVHSAEKFWQENCLAARFAGRLPEEVHKLGTAGVGISSLLNGAAPAGHYNANYRKAVEKGFGTIRQEALDKIKELQGSAGENNNHKLSFYEAIVISCDSAILLAKRYAEECRVQADELNKVKRP